MFERLVRLNEQIEREFGERIQMGVGIHGGEAIVGTMGPPKTPLLTAVGDNINIAARMEQKAKDHNVMAVISPTVADELNGLDLSLNRIGEETVKGISKPIGLFTLD